MICLKFIFQLVQIMDGYFNFPYKAQILSSLGRLTISNATFLTLLFELTLKYTTRTYTFVLLQSVPGPLCSLLLPRPHSFSTFGMNLPTECFYQPDEQSY